MHRDLVWLAVPLVLVLGLAPQVRAARGDDDLLNMGNTPVPAKTRPAPAPSAGSRPVTPPADSPTKAPTTPAMPLNGVTVIDRVKAVPRKALLKRRRLELTPYTGLSMNDPFIEHLEFGGSVVFYPHDAFGIGAGVDWFYVHARTSNVDAVRLQLTSVLAPPDLPKVMAHVDFYWLPVYGKVSLFQNFIVNFDLYASAGLGVATAFNGRAPIAAANIAIGQHYALEQWLALRFEVRDHLFVDRNEANAIARSSIQSYVMFLVGLSFYIPPTFEYTFQ